MAEVTHEVYFDNNLLTSVSGLRIRAIDTYKPARRRLDLQELVRSHKSKNSSGFYDRRSITVSVGISRTNRAQVEQSLDILVGLLQGLEKTLIVPQSGASRKYTCSLADIDVTRGGDSYIEADIVFECVDRFGYEIPWTLIASASGQTTAYRLDTVTYAGSAPTQVPVINVTFTAVTGGASASVIVGNDNTGQSISVTRDWIAGDALVIDSNARTVKVNGVDVDFTGAFPEFKKGAGTLTFSNTMTSRTYTYLAYYYKRYV